MRRILLTCALAFVLSSAAQAGRTVQFDVTGHGTFEVKLHDNTPLHRDNFLSYVTAGLFDNTIIHRSDDLNNVIQGGGFCESANPDYLLESVPTFAPVTYEGNLGDSNIMMTFGAARSTDPNSATSQWYINMADNSAGFDDQPGPPAIPGYTVFGHVVSGWNTVLAIYGLDVWNFGAPFNTLPLEDSYPGSGMPAFSDLVIIASVTPEPATLVWMGDPSGAWDVSATANWSNEGAGSTYWQGDDVVFADTASGTPLVNLAGTVRPGSVLVDNDAVDFAFTGAGSIAGPCGLTKRGSGTLTLAAANAYTGDTRIEGGTLTVAVEGALGAGAVTLGDATGPSDASLLVSGALTVDRHVTVQDDGSETSSRVLGGTHTAGTASFSGGLTLGGGVTLTAAPGGTVRLAAALDNSGGHTIAKTGQGTVVFDGAQTHGPAARLEVGAGTVDLNTDAGSAAAAALAVAVTGAAVNFGSDQHLASLEVTGGTARLAAGGSRVLVAGTLVLASNASLD
ncbi:MAG: peptidylprolyl isomerase, partial [Planctomycetes bacterium]|nr:peptidylprolyl isomerase [Planctomycetota bacterium]